MHRDFLMHCNCKNTTRQNPSMKGRRFPEMLGRDDEVRAELRQIIRSGPDRPPWCTSHVAACTPLAASLDDLASKITCHWQRATRFTPALF
jgi:hypothetical protein